MDEEHGYTKEVSFLTFSLLLKYIPEIFYYFFNFLQFSQFDQIYYSQFKLDFSSYTPIRKKGYC